jgi:hypothetical protein
MPNPRGRPRSELGCPHCGAPPSHQHGAPTAPQPERHLIAEVELPGCGKRRLYAHSAENARAARAALARDPSLASTIAIASYEDVL